MDQEPKQVIVVRKDLNMRKGKLAAQVAHASMKVILDRLDGLTSYDDLFGDYITDWRMMTVNDTPLEKWLKGRFTKIVVSVDSEQQLLEVYDKARLRGIICALITDAGLTEFNGVPTNTCCAIGPDYPEIIDTITGDLKLL